MVRSFGFGVSVSFLKHILVATRVRNRNFFLEKAEDSAERLRVLEQHRSKRSKGSLPFQGVGWCPPAISVPQDGALGPMFCWWLKHLSDSQLMVWVQPSFGGSYL